MTRSQVLVLGVAMLAVAACFSPLSITGSRCPCPPGYCCTPAGTCVRGAACSAAGGNDGGPDAGENLGNSSAAGDTASDGGDAATDGGTQYVKTLVAAGDELVVGFLPSGTSLVTIGEPTTSRSTSTQGDLRVHRLDKGTVEDSGTIVSVPEVGFSNQRDALAAGSFIWTPDLGFSKGTSPFISPDGSLFGTFDSDPSDAQTKPSRMFIFSTPDFSQPPVATIPLGDTFYGAYFSPDARFLFVFDEAMPNPLWNKVRRIALKGSVGTVDTAVVTHWPFNFDSRGDPFWANAPDGVFVWRAGSSSPVQIASFGPGDVPTDIGGDAVYVGAGGIPWTHTDRISALTGEREPVSQDEPTEYLATSANGSLALLFVRDGVRVMDLNTNRITARLFSCPDPLFDAAVGLARELAFTADSAFVIGGWYSCTVSGSAFPSPDVVSVDVSGGQVRTLAAQGYVSRPLYAGAGRVVFARPLPNAEKSDLMLAYADGRPTELLAPGIDTHDIAVNGRTIAYSLHGDAATEGIYTLTLPSP
jgi:hypothetical protein